MPVQRKIRFAKRFRRRFAKEMGADFEYAALVAQGRAAVMGIKNSAVRVIASAIALAFIFIRPLLFCTGYAVEEENMRDWWSV